MTFLYHTFCQSLDSGVEIRVVFCDVSKAFNLVSASGLSLSSWFICSLLSWFNDFLTNRRQKVSHAFILVGILVMQVFRRGSITCPLLFLLHTNDIVVDLRSIIRLYADDSSLYIMVENPITAAQIFNSDLEKNR